MTTRYVSSLGWTRSGWIAALGLVLLMGLPARAQETSRDESEPQSSRSQEDRDRLDRLVNARLDVELLGLEVEAERARINQILLQLRNLGMSGPPGFAGNLVNEEGVDRNMEMLDQQLEKSKHRYREKSLELAHARQRLADLGGESAQEARPNPVPDVSSAPVPAARITPTTDQDRRLSEIIRGINALLKTVEHPKDSPHNDE